MKTFAAKAWMLVLCVGGWNASGCLNELLDVSEPAPDTDSTAPAPAPAPEEGPQGPPSTGGEGEGNAESGDSQGSTGGDAEGSDPGAPTGDAEPQPLPADLPLRDLTPDQREALCLLSIAQDAAKHGLQPGDTFECKEGGAVDIGRPEECKEFREFELDCDYNVGELLECTNVEAICDVIRFKRPHCITRLTACMKDFDLGYRS